MTHKMSAAFPNDSIDLRHLTHRTIPQGLRPLDISFYVVVFLWSVPTRTNLLQNIGKMNTLVNYSSVLVKLFSPSIFLTQRSFLGEAPQNVNFGGGAVIAQRRRNFFRRGPLKNLLAHGLKQIAHSSGEPRNRKSFLVRRIEDSVYSEAMGLFQSKEEAPTRLSRRPEKAFVRSDPTIASPERRSKTIMIRLHGKQFKLHLRPNDTVENFVATLCDKANLPFNAHTAKLQEKNTGVVLEAFGPHGKDPIHKWLQWLYKHPSLAGSTPRELEWQFYQSEPEGMAPQGPPEYDGYQEYPFQQRGPSGPPMDKMAIIEALFPPGSQLDQHVIEAVYRGASYQEAAQLLQYSHQQQGMEAAGVSDKPFDPLDYLPMHVRENWGSLSREERAMYIYRLENDPAVQKEREQKMSSQQAPPEYQPVQDSSYYGHQDTQYAYGPPQHPSYPYQQAGPPPPPQTSYPNVSYYQGPGAPGFPPFS